MKKIIAAAILLGLVLFLIPLGLREARTPTPQQTEEPELLTLPESGHTLTVLVEDAVQTLDLNDYLWGVVAAEMPAAFEQEALKAQAVAARTYALNKAGRAARHPQADLCTDYTCCQAWISREAARANWGENAAVYTNKITTAVAETNNEVIYYEGKLIDAVFHSSSAAATQDAVEVWGGSVPYLQSVASPEGEEVPNYYSEAVFTPEEFRDCFLAARPEAVLEGSPTGWVGEVSCTEGGSVRTITIGGVTVTGPQAREIFGLRSATFTVEATEEAVTFSVIGYGHGVGMSQYGANAMAQAGQTYREILEHYYTGVTVASYTPDEA